MVLLKKTIVFSIIFSLLFSTFQKYFANELRNLKDLNHNTEITSKIPNSLLYKIYLNDIENINDQNTFLESQIEKKSYKSPWLAFGLAMLFPGLGQVYNGEYGKLGIIYGVAFLGAGLATVALANSSYGTSKTEPSYVAPLGTIGFGLIGVSFFYSIIDAPISANKINEENLKVTISIKPTTINKNQGITFETNKENKYGMELTLQIGF